VTNELNKRLEEMATDLETKARLTKAEKLLLQAKALIERQAQVNQNLNVLLDERDKSLDACRQAYGEGMDKMEALEKEKGELERRLNLIPRWIQRIFNAD